MNSAVERAIKCIWQRYSDPLSLTDIAQSAILSRFHFCRIFKDDTGVSPVRFLSAVRIYHAKRLLMTTDMSVTDISFAVGYNSLGSFTNHFTDSVGISPGRFRRIAQDGEIGLPSPRPVLSLQKGEVRGTISLPEEYATARVYVGVFRTPIVQCCPVAATTVELGVPDRDRPYRLPAVAAGEWFIHAIAVADSADPEPWTRRALLIGEHAPVRVTAGRTAGATMTLRPRCATDLPILLALPDLAAEPGSRALPVPEGIAGPVAGSVVARAAS